MLRLCSCCLGIKPNKEETERSSTKPNKEETERPPSPTSLRGAPLLKAAGSVDSKKKTMKLRVVLCALLAIVALITAAVAAGANMVRAPPGPGGGKVHVQALPWPIQFANAEGHANRVEAWLNGGGDVDARDEDGSTLLMIAAFHRREPNVEMLLRRGAAVNLQTPGAGLTALMAATLKGDTAIVRRLLEAGAATGLRSGHGETALQIAKRKGFGFAECARLLQSYEPAPSGRGP